MNIIYKYWYYPFLLVSLGCQNQQVNNSESLFEEEQKRITEQTKIIDISNLDSKEMLLSSLIDSIEYVKLDDTKESFLYSIAKAEIIDSLIYLNDYNGSVKCFSLSGKFIRNCYEIGRASNEVLRFEDFTVDTNYLYILDITKNSLLFFDHKGNFVKSDKLPFRAHRIKKSGNFYLFEVSPYSLKNGLMPYKVVITDLNYNIINQYISQDDNLQGYRLARRIYFGSNDTNYFSPMMGHGIYEIKDSLMQMNYYIKSKYEFNSKIERITMEDAIINKYYPLLKNTLSNNDYLFQTLGSGRKYSKLLMIDKKTGDYQCIDKFINDMDNIIEFRFNDGLIYFDFSCVLGYLKSRDMFYGIFVRPFIPRLTQTEIQEIKSKLSPQYHDILLAKEGEDSQILFFIKMKKDIFKID